MKESEIRNREALNRYLEVLHNDTLRLFKPETFEDVACPACGYAQTGADKSGGEFEKMGFRYVLCPKCQTLYVSPGPTPETLEHFYSNSESTDFWVKEFFMPVAEVRREKIFKPRAGFIAEQFPKLGKSKIGDIGAGFGLFLEELRKIWPSANYVAIEPSDEMAKICESKSLQVIHKMVEDINDDTDGGFDLLTAFELFEHLHNPGVFLQKVHSLLKPGGYLVITTLNGMGFDIQLLWEKSKSISPPQHLNFFNLNSICLLLEKSGFKVVSTETPGQLDWDIVEGVITQEGAKVGRFWETVANSDEKTKSGLQQWITGNKLSSHMRVIAER